MARKRSAESYTQAEWARLAAWVAEDDSPCSVVLHVQMATGLRIGDVLRLERTSLQRALHSSSGSVELLCKGGVVRQLPIAGAQEAWDRLARAWDCGATVAAWICPGGTHSTRSGYGAYKAVRRHLGVAAEQLQLRGRPHLHRLRRTVATRALHASQDIHAVQQLLGHRSISSTERYLDEPRLDAVAALQRQIQPEKL